MNQIIQFLRNTLFNVESLRFVVVGVVATAIHYGVYAVLFHFMALSHNVAYTVGYATSLVFNCVATFVWGFRTAFTWLKVAKFLGCHAINYFLHIIFLNFFIWIGLPPLIAPAAVYCIVVPINLFLVRYALKNTFLYRDDEKDSRPDTMLQ